MKKRILLLSAYDAMSHRQWRLSLSTLFSEYDWTQLALPPRHFNWRIRGNSLTWGLSRSKVLQQDYDLLIATSMVDLASLRGFQPALSQLPTLVYFHENQFVYPRSSEQLDKPYNASLDATMVSLYAALCADQVVFNSDYNRDTFLAGVKQLLARLPDQVPDGIAARLAGAVTIPVPLPQELFASARPAPMQPEILDVAWNHRWEYDKGPELLLALVQAVVARGLPIRFHIMGQQFRRQPREFELVRKLLCDSQSRLHHHVGYVTDPDDYYRRLAACDVVLSTALHDFQGLAVLEGCALGCTPLCPNDLVYPEYLDSRFLYSSGAATSDATVTEALEKLHQWQQAKARGEALPEFQPCRFSPDSVKESYLSLFDRLWI